MSGFSFELIDVTERKKPENKEFAKYIGPEDNLQKAVAKYLNMINSDWFHCPNGGSRNKIEAAKLKAMGVKPGVSDVIIFDKMQGYKGFIIELKVGKNKPSDEQLAFIEKRKKQGWLTLITWSLDEAIFWIDFYYSIFNVKNIL